MVYDETLADRIRELVEGEEGFSETKMLGGLASSDATVAEMRGRLMPGWLRVDAEHLRTKRQLTKWVKVGVDFAKSLPPKWAAKRKPAPTGPRTSR